MNSFEAGKEAERIAEMYERARLGLDRSSRFVRLVSHRTTLGYDLESRDDLTGTSKSRFIEVKAVSNEGDIIITEREREVLTSLGDRAYLYLVNLARQTVVKVIQNPFSKTQVVNLVPCAYKARF